MYATSPQRSAPTHNFGAEGVLARAPPKDTIQSETPDRQAQTHRMHARGSRLRVAALPPERVFVTIPQCASGPEASCTLEGFRQLVLGSIKAECVTTVPVDAL